jgi:HD-like signal output (HDOD) protein
LLAIWGVPQVLFDAVRYHHDPASAPEAARQLASIVHFADSVIPHLPVQTQLNTASLERAGTAHLVPQWEAVAQRLRAEEQAG